MRALAIPIALALLAHASTARAQQSTDPAATGDTRRAQPPGVRQGFAIEGAATAWNPAWQPRAHTADYAVIGVAAGIAVAGAIIKPREKDLFPRFVLFDEGARDTLRLGSQDNRYRIRDASDVGVSLLTTWPILVDSLITAWWYRGNPEVARNIAIMDAEVIAIVAALQSTSTTFFGRERPYGPTCGDALTVDCESRARYRSFFSGHASQSFAGATVLCVNHLGMKLLGNEGDAFTCAGALVVAATTSTFRMMGDMHYASDVITGALIGSTVGLAIPLFHGVSTVSVPGGTTFQLAPIGNGLGIRGTF